ncbi:GNAT family N-acetyltransferase [Streptomyces sp. enrichment culture]|uniref:GNAT family N-acetyltransferase n=1 Tax=Streptomyces sp. enrichment culture TaxID=1795815 RepID=UPI003F550DCD
MRYVSRRPRAREAGGDGGERSRPPCRTGNSAVRAAPEARGRGRAVRLAGALAARVMARGARPFPWMAEASTGVIALDARLGFTPRGNDLPRVL